MSKKPSDARSRGHTPQAGSQAERRSPPGAPGSLRWFKGLLGRPVALQRRDGRLHMVLVERRRPPEERRAQALEMLRDELRTRLLGDAHEHAAQAMRHLVFVHDELGRKGWAGVEAMPALVLRKALVQAQMLQDQEASPALTKLIDRVRVLLVGAELREERQARCVGQRDHAQVEVSEATQEDFEATERSWVGAVPAVKPPAGES